MKAVIVTIGDEILIGQITDTNSGYLAKSLDKIGIATVEMRSISDDRAHILSTLKELQNQVDLVLLTGGLGPTKDDITKKTFCDYFNDSLVWNQEVETHVVALIERVMKRPASQINKDQALVPSRCEVLFNGVGTAPGMWIQHEQTVFVSMPGVPYEMKHIWEQALQPKLIETFKRPFIIHQTVLTYGQGESLVAERIEAWEDALPPFIKLAYLPSPGRVRLRLTARGTDEHVLQSELKSQITQLHDLIGDIIVGMEEDQTIEVQVGQLMAEKGFSLAVAESCTGGKIAEMITAIAGSSRYFKGGIVAYTETAKTNLLDVSPELIACEGVVSEATAFAMAIGAQQKFQADFALATTGNAGPSAGDPKQALGTVCIALATPNGTFTQTLSLGQPREKVIMRAANEALNMLFKSLKN